MWATCGPPCSTGHSLGITAGPSFSGWRTQTQPATPRNRTTGCSSHCDGWGSSGTRARRWAANSGPIASRCGLTCTQRWPLSCTRAGGPITATAPRKSWKSDARSLAGRGGQVDTTDTAETCHSNRSQRTKPRVANPFSASGCPAPRSGSPTWCGGRSSSNPSTYPSGDPTAR